MNRRILPAKWNAVVLAGLLALLVFLPFYFTPYNNAQITMVMIFAVAILGLNLIAGYTGQLTVAQSFFLGIGGYGTAIFITEAGLPHLLTIPLAGLIGFVVSFVIAVPVLRLRGFYLMVVTLALVFSLSPLIKRWDSLTHGADGIVVPTPAEFGGLAPDQVVYFICLAVAVVMFAAAARLVRSPYGPAMIAIRDREEVADVIGVHSSRVKILVFAMAGLYAGVAGSLYVFAIGFVSPDSFAMLLALSLFAGAFLGGISTISGAAIGALFVQFVPRFGSEIHDSLTGVIFGAAVIVCMLLLPTGIAGIGARLATMAQGLRRPAETSTDPARTDGPPQLRDDAPIHPDKETQQR
jgi:branched-chain amino acid transport system permease protein